MKIIKINRINYYLLLSLLIHFLLILFTYKEKEVSLGNKIIPIEIINIESKPSRGEYYLKPEEPTINNKQKRIKKENLTNKELNREVIKEGINKSQKKVKNELKSYAINEKTRKNKNIGTEGYKNTNEVEKGSLKGKGIEKITCLSCLRPVYPKYALRKGLGGNVIVKVWIGVDGKVEKTNLINSSGIKIIDKSAIQAAKNSRFYPLLNATTLNIEYQLRIE